MRCMGRLSVPDIFVWNRDATYIFCSQKGKNDMIPQHVLSQIAMASYGDLMNQMRHGIRQGEYGFRVAFSDRPDDRLEAVFFKLISDGNGMKKYVVVEVLITKLDGGNFQAWGETYLAHFASMDILDMVYDELNALAAAALGQTVEKRR